MIMEMKALTFKQPLPNEQRSCRRPYYLHQLNAHFLSGLHLWIGIYWQDSVMSAESIVEHVRVWLGKLKHK